MFLFFLAVATQAQNFGGGGIAGFSTSQVSGDRLSGFNKVGFVAGALASIPVSERVGVQMEITYIQKGSRKNLNPEKNDFRAYRLDLNYVEVPIIVLYHYNKKLVIEGGPSLGTLVHSKEQDEQGSFTEQRPFKKTELSINAGISYPLISNLMLNWRISNSLLPVRPHVSGETFRLNMGQYNTVLAFTLRYQVSNKD
jgi:hypothetical protein